jgi:hypothetical protein
VGKSERKLDGNRRREEAVRLTEAVEPNPVSLTRSIVLVSSTKPSRNPSYQFVLDRTQRNLSSFLTERKNWTGREPRIRS